MFESLPYQASLFGSFFNFLKKRFRKEDDSDDDPNGDDHDGGAGAQEPTVNLTPGPELNHGIDSDFGTLVCAALFLAAAAAIGMHYLNNRGSGMQHASA